MKLGAKGEALIKSFEKLAYVAYRKIINGKPDKWTAGWGHTGDDVTEGTTCDDAQAEAWFLQDTQSVVNANMRELDVAVNQNQFDALVSFAYNVGIGAEAHSTLLRLVNSGHLQEAADQFLLWCHDNGQVSEGLLRRRRAERALFLTPIGVSS